MNLFLWILIALIPFESVAAFAKVRRVAATKDQIVTINTALGIATIIQVPDRPNSLVVGDTESFKVEYLDQAITIKPLHGSARSNLYIYTDYRRFNVQLVTGAEGVADYVVYLDLPKEKVKEETSGIKWIAFRNSLKNDSLSLEVTRLARTRDGVLLVEFRIKSAKREKIDPQWIWLTQSGSTKPIHRLVLSRLDADSRTTVDGIIQILKSDIRENVPLRLELRRKQTSYLTLPEVTSWK